MGCEEAETKLGPEKLAVFKISNWSFPGFVTAHYKVQYMNREVWMC